MNPGKGFFFFIKTSRPVLMPTNLPVEWVVRGLFGSEVVIVRLTVHLRLVLMFRISSSSALPACLHGMDRNNLTFYSVGVFEK
jgi:hypothetical protein